MSPRWGWYDQSQQKLHRDMLCFSLGFLVFSQKKQLTLYTITLKKKKTPQRHRLCVCNTDNRVKINRKNICLLALWVWKYPSCHYQHWLTSLDNSLWFMASSPDLAGGCCSAKEKGIKFIDSSDLLETPCHWWIVVEGTALCIYAAVRKNGVNK